MSVVAEAAGLVFQPYVLLVILAAAAFGMFVGAIPGLTATMATALLVPVTFFMEPVPAIAAIVTATAMAIFVGGVSALAPNKRGVLAQVALKALLAATLACLMTACVAGALFTNHSILFQP